MTYLTVAQVAQRLDASETTVRRWIRDGRLPATRHGARVWLIEESALEGFKRPKKGPPFKGGASSD